MVTDVIMSKFSELMERLNMRNNAADTGKKLQEKKLLRKDINNMVSYVTPIIPFVGLIEGGLTVAGDVVSHKMSQPEKEKEDSSEQSE